MSFLPYGRQSIAESDIERVVEVLRGDWLTTGPAIEVFEKALASKVAASFSVACSSGTAALHLAYRALGLGSGDRLVVPAITFSASAATAVHEGADLVFADVEADSGLMDLQDLERILNADKENQVKAICLVHLNGQSCDLNAVQEVVGDRNIALVEDACHAIGAEDLTEAGPRPIGSCHASRMTCFSFHPVKTVTTAEGGAVTTNDPGLAQRLQEQRNHGILRDPQLFENKDGSALPWYHEIQELGYNYRLNDLQAALGAAQLEHLDQFVARRAELVARYDKALSDLSPLVKPIERKSHCWAAWHLYPILIDFHASRTNRAEVMRRLASEDIGTQVHYIPLPLQPAYQAWAPAACPPGARAYYDRVLSLPLFPAMEDGDVERVVRALRSALGL